jgi:hypothetical protein
MAVVILYLRLIMRDGSCDLVFPVVLYCYRDFFLIQYDFLTLISFVSLGHHTFHQYCCMSTA